jgi:hypothetical protein
LGGGIDSKSTCDATITMSLLATFLALFLTRLPFREPSHAFNQFKGAVIFQDVGILWYQDGLI